MRKRIGGLAVKVSQQKSLIILSYRKKNYNPILQKKHKHTQEERKNNKNKKEKNIN